VAALSAAAPLLYAQAAADEEGMRESNANRPAVSIVDLTQMSPACNCACPHCSSNTLATPQGVHFAALKRLQLRRAARAGKKLPLGGEEEGGALDSEDEQRTLLAITDSTGGTVDGWGEGASVGAEKGAKV
jgi:hypothetical protein